MKNTVDFWFYLIVMAGVTYLIRVIPFVLCKTKVKNRYLKSFLAYVPYTVLGAMTFPAILYATSSIGSAIAGMLIAVILAIRKKSLIVVAVSSCIAVYVFEWIARNCA